MDIMRELTHGHVDLHLTKASIRKKLRAYTPDMYDDLRRQVHLLADLLAKHVEMEEDVVFPDAVDLLGDDRDVNVLIGEHAALLEAVNVLVQTIDGVADGGPGDDFREAFHTFDTLFEVHSEHEANFFDHTANYINPANAGGA